MGPRIFGDIIGLPVACKDCLQPSLSLAYVIDTSLSMSEDLEQIKSKVQDTINGGLAVPKNMPTHFVVSTFSDPCKAFCMLSALLNKNKPSNVE